MNGAGQINREGGKVEMMKEAITRIHPECIRVINYCASWITVYPCENVPTYANKVAVSIGEVGLFDDTGGWRGVCEPSRGGGGEAKHYCIHGVKQNTTAYTGWSKTLLHTRGEAKHYCTHGVIRWRDISHRKMKDSRDILCNEQIRLRVMGSD